MASALRRKTRESIIAAVLVLITFVSGRAQSQGNVPDVAINERSSLWAVVLDNSLSMKNEFELLKFGADSIVDVKGTNDGFLVIRFVGSSGIDVLVPETKDVEILRSGLSALRLEGGNQEITLNGRTFRGLGGQTAILDAVYLAADALVNSKLCTAEACTRNLVLITDGEERQSYYSKKDVMRRLRDGGVRVFAIGLTASLDKKIKSKAKDLLTELGEKSSGAVFFPTTNAEMEAAITSIQKAAH